jgi:hypothetical protein
MKRIAIILCILFAVLLAVPVESEAGLCQRLRGLLSRRPFAAWRQARQASAPRYAPRQAPQPAAAGPVYRRECSGNSCRMVRVN